MSDAFPLVRVYCTIEALLVKVRQRSEAIAGLSAVDGESQTPFQCAGRFQQMLTHAITPQGVLFRTDDVDALRSDVLEAMWQLVKTLDRLGADRATRNIRHSVAVLLRLTLLVRVVAAIKDVPPEHFQFGPLLLQFMVIGTMPNEHRGKPPEEINRQLISLVADSSAPDDQHLAQLAREILGVDEGLS